MMDTRDEIFAVAKELPPHERGPYLDAACDSPEQRQRVEELLRDATGADDFFAPFEPPSAPPLFEKPGDIIDRYKLLQKIGEGGFGAVFMAEQREPIVRRVALKIIKAGMDTRQVIARFEAERQALAMMDHPGIAKVLDAGATPTGRPYFVMELVRGLPVTTFCDQQEYDTRRRIELFAEICSAVQHAHQKGIIHRDLKPSNIIVGLDGDQPVLKIIDFGIAKATQQQLTDKTLFTRFEQFIGTPLYISPEQASLSAIDIDTRSDIYSLGVLLYELLTGKPPIDASELLAGGFDEMRRIIREKEAPKPSTRLATIGEQEIVTIAKARQTEPRKLGLFIRGELDWIVLKALEKDRRRRYETANALRADLQRFLRNEPVSAAAPGTLYQLRKFLARHRVGVTMAAAFAVVLVAATTVSSWLALRATKAENQARSHLAAVAAERDQKDQARRDAEALADFLTEVFRSPDPARLGRSVTVAETLDRAAARLGSSLDAQPDQCAGAMQNLANSLDDTGRRSDAMRLRLIVLDKTRDHFGPDHPRTLSAMQNLAISHERAGDHQLALDLRQQVLAKLRATNRSGDPDMLRAIHNLALSLEHADRHADALALRQEGLQQSRRILGADHPDTIQAMDHLAASLDLAQRHAEARALREQASDLRRKTLHAAPRLTLVALARMLPIYESAGRPSDVEALRAEIARRAEQEIPEIPGDDHLAALQIRAESRARHGRWQDAATDSARLLELDPLSIRFVHLAALLLQSNDTRALRDLAAKALGQYAATTDPQDAERAAKICWLAPAICPDPDQANELTRKALAAEGYVKPWALLTAGLAELRQDKPAEAAATLARCIESGIAPEGKATTFAALAIARFRQDQTDAARDALDRATTILGNTFQQSPASPQQVPFGQWYDWLIARALHREATSTLAP